MRHFKQSLLAISIASVSFVAMATTDEIKADIHDNSQHITENKTLIDEIQHQLSEHEIHSGIAIRDIQKGMDSAHKRLDIDEDWIAQHKTESAQIKTDVKNNTAIATANKTAISNNTTNTKANTATITSNTSAINDNKSQIAKNVTGLAD
ncbi:hypothetical protein, partial [Photobacterium leiognathi]